MTTSEIQTKKGGTRRQRVRSGASGKSVSMVQAQHQASVPKPAGQPVPNATTMLTTLRLSGEQLWSEAISRQRGLFGWWYELVRSCADVELWSRKASVLSRRLMAASLSANEKWARVGVEQQRSAAGLCEETQWLLKPMVSLELQPFATSAWPRFTEAARAWAMIPIAAHVRIAGAWADFWSLPSAGNSGGEHSEVSATMI